MVENVVNPGGGVVCRAVKGVDVLLGWEKGSKTVVPEVGVGPGADGV